MALVNHAKKEINAKIVYFGPAAIGKSTVLKYLYSRIKPSLRGELKTIPATADNLMFFDFSPFEAPLSNGYNFRLHLYTLTGTVNNPATWKMTLKGVDGLMILINPDPSHTKESIESVSQLRDFLSGYGVGIHETPTVLQLNNFSGIKQEADVLDIANILDLANHQVCTSDAISGEGVVEALTLLSRQLLEKITAMEFPLTADVSPDIQSGKENKIETAKVDVSSNSDIKTLLEVEPELTVIKQDIVTENSIIKIPIEIRQGDSNRRIVLSISASLE